MNDQELKALFDTVAAEVAVLVKSAPLAKAHEGESTSPEVTPDDSATSPEGSAPPADASPEGPPVDASPEGPPADASPEASPEDPAAGGEIDADALAAEYGKMEIQDLQAHYLACKAALAAKMPADADGSPAGAPSPDMGGAPPAPDMSASPAGPPAPPPAASPSSPPMAASPPPPPEVKAEPSPIGKSEQKLLGDLAALQKTVDDQKTVMTHMQRVIELTTKAPQPKAVTDISQVTPLKKGEDLASLPREEIKRRLGQKARHEGLSKADRTVINQFCVDRTVGFDKVKHLLVEAA